MALFINPENQNILWEMVNKVPLCSAIFPPGSQNQKNNWFKGIIQDYYNRIPPNISRNDLYKINRDVLSTMVKSLQSISNANSIVDPYPNTMPIDKNMLRTQRGPQNFEERKLQYDSLFQIRKPDQIDFTEKLDDDVITNMEELVANQRKIRELDLQEFSPKMTEEAIQLQKPPQIQKHVRFDLSGGDEVAANDKTIKQENIFLRQKIENMEDKITQILSLLQTLVPSSHKSSQVTEGSQVTEEGSRVTEGSQVTEEIKNIMLQVDENNI